MNDDTPWTDQQRQQVQDSLAKVFTSPLFEVSDRQQRLLRYLVEEALAGRASRINQTAIAIDVMGRDERFDPAIDSIVRVEAARLRSKLREYYESEGAADVVRFRLPKGKYVPSLNFVEQGLEATIAPTSVQVPNADVVDVEAPVPGFQARPAIAVLPFTNLSGDPDQVFFAEGLAEDIITSLSLFRWFPVIARNSSFVYRDGTVDTQKMARALGARYLVQGSVRTGSGKVRITAQLIDAADNIQLWANRYDRELENIFEVQDEVTEQIVTSIAPEFQRAEIKRTERRDPKEFSAWEMTARGVWHYNQHSAVDNSLARKYFDDAVLLDSSYGRPLAWASFTHVLDVVCGWSDDPVHSYAQALAVAKRAVDLEPQNADAHAALSLSLIYQRKHDQAIEAGERAVELNPSNPYSYLSLGVSLCWAGEYAEALTALRTALRLNPLEPVTGHYLNALGLVYLMLREYQQAAEVAKRAIQADPSGFRPYHRLAIALAYAGDLTAAAAALSDAGELPHRSLAYIESSHPFRDPKELEFIVTGLRKAGWSDTAA